MSDNGASSQPTRREELTPRQKAARITWFLAKGQKLTVEDVMRHTGLKKSAACALLNDISGAIPIYPEANVWQEVAVKIE